MIANYKHLKNGPQALFSSYSQDILFSNPEIEVGSFFICCVNLHYKMYKYQWLNVEHITHIVLCICNDYLKRNALKLIEEVEWYV